MTELERLAATGRALSPEECVDLARRVAERVDPAQHLRDDPHQRVFELLWRNEHSEAWLVSWWGPRDTGFHDHDGSNGGIHVIEGRVTEEPLVVGRPQLVREYGPGDSFSFSGSRIHRMSHDPGAVSIHLYSPPLARLGSYDLVDGVLTRTPCSPDDETPATPGLDAAIAG